MPIRVTLPFGGIASLYRMYVWRRIPRLHVRVDDTGAGGDALTFRARVSETGNLVPAMDTTVMARLDGVADPVFVSEPFTLQTGETDRVVRFTLKRPELGTLVKACNDEPTLYGRTLTVEARSGRHKASDEWREKEYDPDVDAARHEMMQILREFDAAGLHLAGSLDQQGLRKVKSDFDAGKYDQHRAQ